MFQKNEFASVFFRNPGSETENAPFDGESLQWRKTCRGTGLDPGCLIVPNAESIKDSLASVYEVYQSAADGMLERFGMRALTADEGGLAPSFENSIQVLEEACSAIERAGLKPGQEMHLAVDVASSHFYKEAKYELDGESLTGQEMIQTLNEWASRFPLVSIEDGLHEEAWEFWPELTQALDNLCLTLGDDFLCYQSRAYRRAVETRPVMHFC